MMKKYSGAVNGQKLVASLNVSHLELSSEEGEDEGIGC